MPLILQDFVSKWKRADARGHQSIQEHFIDLCTMVGFEMPMQAIAQVTEKFVEQRVRWLHPLGDRQFDYAEEIL